MANHKSARKAHGQSLRRREHNRQLRSHMRHTLTAARGAIDAVGSTGNDNATQAREVVQSTVALIDTLAGKGVIHRNAAARHKARLSTRLEKASAAA